MGSKSAAKAIMSVPAFGCAGLSWRDKARGVWREDEGDRLSVLIKARPAVVDRGCVGRARRGFCRGAGFVPA
ncbi:hypothetical protein [Candidatus Accumulibacter sp. ACC012]|uniref:hypothetical protein n=1 Tax=Candidatus Accumulibacter sp. ACC012 TaxID=2823332 RepID=UPI0025BA2347|nr:hypothetical protein [Candidatus Accumulibacter sp. ACC012]